MGSIIHRKNKDGTESFRATVRRKTAGGEVVNKTQSFAKRRDAEIWIERMDAAIETGKFDGDASTLGALIQRYIDEYEKISGWGRSKAADLRRLSGYPIAMRPATTLTSQHYIAHATWRRQGGASASTVLSDISWISTVMQVSRSAWGIRVDLQELADARNVMTRMKITAKSQERDRRPTPDEIRRIREFLSRSSKRSFNGLDLFDFAIASARRLSEMVNLRWDDFDAEKRVVLVRNLKNPNGRKINGKAAMTDEAVSIVVRQPRVSELIFPVQNRTVERFWQRTCDALGIQDLHWHDLRHEAVSRLFERGYQIHEVMHFSLHQDWRTLRRYTHLMPEDVRRLDPQAAIEDPALLIRE